MRRTAADWALLAGAILIAALEFGGFPLLAGVTGVANCTFALAVALTGPLHYGLMHETMHGIMFPDTKRNRGIGRVLGVTFGPSWEVNPLRPSGPSQLQPAQVRPAGILSLGRILHASRRFLLRKARSRERVDLRAAADPASPGSETLGAGCPVIVCYGKLLPVPGGRPFSYSDLVYQRKCEKWG